MSLVKTFPHYEINVRATDNYVPEIIENFPLHVPFFIMRAAKGDINVPVWCPNYNYAVYKFGEETFDMYSKYFSRESLFAMKCFERQGCYIIRVADDTAQFSSAVIEAHVQKDVMVTQYEMDNFDQYILDENGERIPRRDSSNQIVKENGVYIKYTARFLDDTEEYNKLKIRTVRVNNIETQIIPIFCFKASSPSELENNVGFKLYYDPKNNDAESVNELKTNFYTFEPVRKPYKSDTVQPIYNRYTEALSNFVFKPDAVVEALDMRVTASDVLSRDFVNSDGDILPFVYYFYNDFIEYLSKIVQSYEINNAAIADSHWMVNILSFTDTNDVAYQHVEYDTYDDDSILFHKDYIVYMTNGSDGNIDNETIEDLTRQYLNMSIYPEFNDKARYPITHLYDTGVTLTTKYAMIKFLSIRDDVKLVLSTQDSTRDLNNKAEDQSVGSSLRARCLLQPESVIFGTGCCRAEILQQAGTLINSNYKGIIPMTYEILDKRSNYQSTDRITGKFKGLPNSYINYIEGFWTPCDDDHKQLSWDTGLNWAQFADRKRKHFPDVRTVYRYETSVLSDTTFTDVVVYAKHIIRKNWARFVGLDIPANDLHAKIKKSVDIDMQAMCGNMYPSEATAYQTDEERRKGYITHVRLDIQGYGISRVWNVDIVCSRENYSVAV